jgi:hypothetical protein
MPIGILFWMLMILWIIFGTWNNWGNHYIIGGNLLLWILLALLGWHDFGFILQGGGAGMR